MNCKWEFYFTIDNLFPEKRIRYVKIDGGHALGRLVVHIVKDYTAVQPDGDLRSVKDRAYRQQ